MQSREGQLDSTVTRP
nr:unnamed protein product [Callosobruchus chinensis]